MSKSKDVFEENDVPPLEDMSDFITKKSQPKSHKYLEVDNSKIISSLTIPSDHEKKNHLKPNIESSKSGTKKLEKKNELKQTNQRTSNPPSTKSSQKMFSGLKAGFLANKKSQENVLKNNISDLPTSQISSISSKLDNYKTDQIGPDLVIPDVKKKFQQPEWLTPELLTKIQSDKELFTALNDPQISEAVNIMAHDPQQASYLYADNPKIQKVFSKFVKFMDSTLNTSKPSEPLLQPIPSEPSNHQIHQWMNDPVLQPILADVNTLEMIRYLQTHPQEISKFKNHPSFKILRTKGIIK